MLSPQHPAQAALHRVLSATAPELQKYLMSGHSACLTIVGTATNNEDEAVAPPPKAGRLLEQPHHQHAPPAFSAACGLVFSAVNDHVIQSTLGFLPPLALAAVRGVCL